MCAYPTNVMVPPPNLQLTVQRVVGFLLLLRCICTAEVRDRFKWNLADTGAVAYLGLLTISQMMTTDPVAAINNKAGFFLSALLPFWCVRLLVVDRPSLYVFMKGFVWMSVPLTFAALYQSYTGDSPYKFIMQNGLFWKEISGQWTEIRPFLGLPFNRASAPFMQCIMLGWFFAIQVTWCTNLWFEKKSVKWWIVPWLFLPLGTIATVSAGPMTMAALSLMCAALFPVRKYWKQMAGTILVILVIISAASKRSLMELLASFGLDASSSYYRVNLLNYMLGKTASMKLPIVNPMGGHWLAGFGTIPHEFDDYHDLCIQWIFLTVVNGLLGLSGFVIFVLSCGAMMWKAGKKAANNLADSWLCWSLLSILLASLFAMQVVALFAEMFFIYHLYLGLIANTFMIVGSESSERHVGVLAEMDGRKVLLRYRLKPGQRLAIVRPGGA